VLTDDVPAGMRHQVMNVGDATGDRVLNRDHAEFGSPDVIAAKQSSKVGQGTASASG
jgi:hypothetical protein